MVEIFGFSYLGGCYRDSVTGLRTPYYGVVRRWDCLSIRDVFDGLPPHL